MVFTPPTAARPWTFRLTVLIVGGCAAVLVILGSAALERRADARHRAELIGDLRRLDGAQREWEARHGEFAREVAPSASDVATAFVASPTVDIRFESHSTQAWSATARTEMPMSAPRTCGIFRGAGAVSPHRAVALEGVVACW